MSSPLYFIGSVSQNDTRYLPIRKAIVQTMQEYGTVLDEHVVREDVILFENEQKQNGVNIYARDTAWLDQAVAGVAEISTATTGGGGEIERMADQGKPLLVLHHKDTRGSWFVNDMPAVYPNVSHKTYFTLEEAVACTRTFLEGLPKPYPGKLIVIDGTDGSGKTTLTKMLVDRLQHEGHRVKTESFPTYGRPSCKGVTAYLNGEFGAPDYVGPFYGSMFYAFNRSKETGPMREDLKNGVHYVLNRYLSANCGHQGGKIADDREREAYLNWIFDLELNRFKIPQPDLTIFLHAPPAIGQQFLAGKTAEERAYLTDGKTRDIHESDIVHLQNAEKSYLFVAARYPSWRAVHCVRPELRDKPEIITDLTIPALQKVRPLQEIHEEIYQHVRGLLAR